MLWLNMSRVLRRAFYQCAKGVGFFSLAKRLSAKKLRILCYHGVSVGDESQFMPVVFMDAATFRSRMELLLRMKVSVLPLGDALEMMENDRLPECPVVITFDDGFYGNYLHTHKIFAEFNLTATFYLTTYYVDYSHPIFRLAVRYMFWKADNSIDLSSLSQELQQRMGEDLKDWMWRIIHYGETACDENGRVVLSRQIADATGFDYDHLTRDRFLSLMQPDEVREMEAVGVDFQLHTHRHRLPVEPDEIRREIEENRYRIETMVHHSVDHLCYPSGIWTKEHWPALKAAGVRSAVTCDCGLNGPETPKYGLLRFLDSEEFSSIEFEAEVSGFTEILRRGRSTLWRLLKS